MKLTVSFLIALAAASLTLTACNRTSDSTESQSADTAPVAHDHSSTTGSEAAAGAEDAASAVRDDTADAALETYVNGVRDGNLEAAIAVLVPDAPGTDKLISMKEGWDRAAAEGAPISMALAMIAGEIDALTYEKISDDGAFATFRFTKPTSETPWEVQAIKTPEGWRITPPPSGLPQN